MLIISHFDTEHHTVSSLLKMKGPLILMQTMDVLKTGLTSFGDSAKFRTNFHSSENIVVHGRSRVG